MEKVHHKSYKGINSQQSDIKVKSNENVVRGNCNAFEKQEQGVERCLRTCLCLYKPAEFSIGPLFLDAAMKSISVDRQ